MECGVDLICFAINAIGGVDLWLDRAGCAREHKLCDRDVHDRSDRGGERAQEAVAGT